MTGAQITDALTQLVNRVAEGWAVGSRDGNPVSSGSPYYHNNAKYYAESSQASAARAEAAVPASTAGAVFFDRSQSLTDAQKAQAQANIGASNTNPNLLDNWWFGTGVINQRAVTSGTEFATNKYRMDRWQTTWGASQNGGTWELTDDGLTLTSTNGGVYFRQKLLNYAFLVGKRITASVMLADGTVYSGSVIRSSGTQLFSHGLQGFAMGFEGSNNFRFGPSGTGYSFTVKAIKLEMGGVSTLANDAPPNPAAELAKCQRYFQRIYLHPNASFGFGYAYSGSSIRYNIPLPVPMRPATVTGTLTGTMAIRGNGQSLTPTSMGFNSYTSSPVDISAQVGACAVTGATINHSYTLVGVDENSYIDISADL